MKLILASSSPRRKELLKMLGIDFQVVPSNFDEDLIKIDDVLELVEELALQKARVVVEKLAKDEDRILVIGGDTLVEVEGEILGKATNEQELREMIKKLSGVRHRVVTGVAVIDGWSLESRVASEESWVRFGELSDEMIDEYLKSLVWAGKAGGYAIQNDPMGFVEGFDGNLSNIIGLPLGLTKGLLEEMGMIVSDVDLKLLEDRLLKEVKDKRKV